MKRSSCRNLAVWAIAVSAMVELGPPPLVAQADPAPAVGLRRFAVSQNVWPGDFNGDGVTDLAGSEPPRYRVGGRVIILVGDGNGRFTQTRATGYIGHVLGVGDFNGDGRSDLIVADEGNANVAILPGNGDATFGAPRAVAAMADVTFALSADIDGDGKRDVLVGAEGFTVALFPGNGDFTFDDPVTLPVNASPHDGIVSDFNGDGKKDLAIASRYANAVTVLLNQGALQFSGADVPIGGNGNDVTVADVNRDGKPDLVVATTNGGDGDFWFTEGHAEVLLGRGDGTFAAGAAYEVPRGAWQVVVGDFTRDGILDIATANRSSIVFDDCALWRKTWDSVSILPGHSDGTFGLASSFSLGRQNAPQDVDFQNQVLTLNTSDVNGDGATDLIASWGAVFLNVEADPNWAPTVDAGPDQDLGGLHEALLQARAVDVDQDMLTWTWRNDAGAIVASWPNVCLNGLHDGVNTFTVTVDDGHGHQATDTMTVLAGLPTGGVSGPTMTLTAPADGTTIAAGTPFTFAFHIDDPSMMLYEWTVDYSIDNGATWNHIWECHNSGAASGPGLPASRDEHCTWQNPGPASTQAILVVYAQDDADAAIGTRSSAHITIAPHTDGIPYPWQHQDVGTVGGSGTTTYDDGVFTVTGSGADIWGTADELQYAYLNSEATGNRGALIVTAHVDSVENLNQWTKAGAMIRASLDPSSPHASVFVSPGKGVVFQRRLAQGGVSVSTAGPNITAPVWVRVTMDGFAGSLRGYYKKNANDPWTLIGQDHAATSWYQPYGGLAVSSHVDGAAATAQFSSVSATHPRDWVATSIGASGGSAAFEQDSATINGTGADIWNTSDQFEFLSDNCVGNCTITTRVASVENTHPWTKAGVMIRETLDAASKQVDAVVSSSKGLAMQYRAATGSTAMQAATASGTAPRWLRLTRAGDVFTSYWSADGITFRELGSATVPMPNAVWIGLAVTSHSAGALAKATFDNILIEQR